MRGTWRHATCVLGAAALLTGCQGGSSNSEIFNLTIPGGSTTSPDFPVTGTWSLSYTWDCSKALAEGKSTADGFVMTVVNADDGSTAYENPETRRTGKSGAGVLAFSRSGTYHLAFDGLCAASVRIDDTESAAGPKRLAPQHGILDLTTTFTAATTTAACAAPAAASGGAVCTRTTGTATSGRLGALRSVVDVQTTAGSSGPPCGPSSMAGQLVDPDGDALQFVANGSYCRDTDVGKYTYSVTGGTASLWGATGVGSITVSSKWTSVAWAGQLAFP